MTLTLHGVLSVVSLVSVVSAVSLLSLVVAVGCAPNLAAPPRLVAAWPAPGARVKAMPEQLQLTFNRELQSEASSATMIREDDSSPVPTSTRVNPSNPRQLVVTANGTTATSLGAGAYRVEWHAVSGRGGAGADGELFYMVDPERTSEPPRLELNGSTDFTVNSGDSLEVVGRGFAGHALVQLAIGDNDEALTSAEADANGQFVANARVPPGIPFGLQPVTADDLSGNLATAAVQVRWGSWPPVEAFVAGQPGPGPGEVTLSVTVNNGSDYLLERVRIALDDPAGGRFVGAQPPGQRETRVHVWELARLDRGVAGPLRARYAVTGPVAGHAKVEFRHRRPRGCSGEACSPAFVSETSSDSTLVYPADR